MSVGRRCGVSEHTDINWCVFVLIVSEQTDIDWCVAYSNAVWTNCSP